jgi:hypothetical protein
MDSLNVPRSRAARAAERRRKRRRAGAIAVAVLAVLVVGSVGAIALLASGGDDSGVAGEASRPTISAPTRSSTTSPTTSPTTTPGTVVAKSADAVVALAQQYDGRYVGAFTNTTSHTTGSVALEIVVDPGTGELSASADFDGDLFGRGGPARRRIAGTVKLGDPNAALSTATDAFGPVTASIDQDLQLVLAARDVPGRTVKEFVLTGRVRDDLTGFDATYTVTFEDGSTSDGTAAVSCDPGGSRASEVVTMCALAAGSAGP